MLWCWWPSVKVGLSPQLISTSKNFDNQLLVLWNQGQGKRGRPGGCLPTQVSKPPSPWFEHKQIRTISLGKDLLKCNQNLGSSIGNGQISLIWRKERPVSGNRRLFPLFCVARRTRKVVCDYYLFKDFTWTAVNLTKCYLGRTSRPEIHKAVCGYCFTWTLHMSSS